MANRYNETNLAKLKAAITDAERQYKADPDSIHIHISTDNRKMGAVPSVSLMPWITCPGNCKDCRGDCYAAKMALLYPSVRKAYAENTVLLKRDPERFARELSDRIKSHNPRYFRFNVAGDANICYAEILLNAAERFPDTEFLQFTRAHKVYNTVLKRYDPDGPDYFPGADYPENMHLLYSAWDKPLTEKENPHGVAQTIVLERGADIPDGVKVCGGNCFECACRGVGCWTIKPGETLAFFKH